MEKRQLKFVLLLSLKEIALRRVAINLWSDSDTLTSILRFQEFDFSTERVKKIWRSSVEDKVKDSMLRCELPIVLQNLMTDTIEEIGLEIRRWKRSLEENFLFSFSPINLPGSFQFCWTTAGAICSLKTAKKLLHCNELSYDDRYLISCFYCLEEYTCLIFGKISARLKEYLLTQMHTFTDLKFLWPHLITKELYEPNYVLKTWGANHTVFIQWAFEYFAKSGNKIATEYFYQKLTNDEREHSLIRITKELLAIPHVSYPLRQKLSDVACYLLKLMTPEQQIGIIKEHPIDVLLCFLDWPRQELFLENADFIFPFIPPSSYSNLLRKMAARFKYSGHYFPKVFQKFFMESPSGLKKCFFDREFGPFNFPVYHFLSIFLESEDKESIEMVFRNADDVDKVNFVSHRSVLELFYKNILNDRWHMVEVCLREATLSKADKERLKKGFMKFLKSKVKGEFKLESPKWEMLFNFLDETSVNAYQERKRQKRKIENCSLA